MAFNSFNEFLAMGGYAFYVWLSYGVTFSLLAILFISSNNQNKAIRKHIIARQKRENKLRQAAEQQAASQENNKQPNADHRSNEVTP